MRIFTVNTGMIIIAVICLLPEDSLAYIDPMSGSIIVQAVIAGIVGAYYIMKKKGKNFLSRILHPFSRHKPESSINETENRDSGQKNG